MGATLRAVRALVLLAGFYLLGFIMLGVLVAADWAVAQAGVGSVTAKVWIVSALLAIPIVQGMFALRTPKDDPLPGLPVTEQQEPALWAAVRSLAEQTGTRAPDGERDAVIKSYLRERDYSAAKVVKARGGI
jgi:hypothetical protein